MTTFLNHTTSSQRLKILLFLGALQILAYYFVGSMLTSRPFSVALPQPDTLLYCQSAKQVALGQPFVFSPGEAPSTGCTSHLYPFLLAVPYLLGMKGATLLLGGFILNAVLYLAFLYAWHHIFESLLDDDRAKLCAAILLGLFGQSACCAFGQTDTGLIMAVTAGAFAAWLKGRRVLFAILLAISPWCRPEGMMLVVGFGFVIVISFIRLFVNSSGRSRQAEPSQCSFGRLFVDSFVRWDVLAVAVAALSAVGVFVFNYCLTGQFQFHSVEFKGYFGNLSFAEAVWRTLTDLITMLCQLVLGQPSGSLVRAAFSLPLLAALFGLAGLFTFDWRSKNAPFAGWLIAALLGLLSVASGGWQGTNYDRYLAWLLPTGLIFASLGVVTASEWAPKKIRWEVLVAPVVAFQSIGACVALSWFGMSSRTGQLNYETLESAKTALTDDKSAVGVTSLCGAAYIFEGTAFRHLSGYYSPAFRSRQTICNIEALKHESNNRFAFWLSVEPKPTLAGWTASPLAGEQVFQGLNHFSLWKTDWALLDAALKPVSTNMPLNGLTLADGVDVGYQKDEVRTAFSVNYRLPGLSYLAFAMDGECDGTRIVDVGRPVIGWSEMRVHLKAGQDAVVVARMAAKTENVRANMYAPGEKLSLKKETRLNIFVDGEPVTTVPATLDEGDGRFTEVSFRIPGHAIKGDTSFVQIYGDHLAFGYWFYQ